ncbi:MAG: pantoate--beta-alanine ligase [Actinomycetota bacterium]|nr:pantoate--beta-alanine ligase [Actinomycetota bacterium]
MSPTADAPSDATPGPVVAHTRDQLREARAALRGDVAVVMTMGALHEGHATLIREARAGADHVIVTIFLNPLQFGPKEDLSRYPRTFESDLAICRDAGVELVFAPTPDVVYPEGDPGVTVGAGVLGTVLEGQSRPGHFDGVLTVVAKLLHLTSPARAFFGQKDAQQLLLIRRMVRDLDWPVDVVAVPTVREHDGLAMSSRNTYLAPSDREAALALSAALWAGGDAAGHGPSAVRRAARAVLVQEPLVLVDYLVLVHPQTLQDVPEWYSGEALLAVAARVGTTRLIDNLPLLLGPGGGPLPVLGNSVPAPAPAPAPAATHAGTPSGDGAPRA